MHIEFLYWEDCPSHEQALARLRETIAEEHLDAPVEVIHVDSEGLAQQLGFPGSPTIRVDGADIAPPRERASGLTCRVYLTDDGRVTPLPTKEMIRRALRDAARSSAGGDGDAAHA